MRPLKSLGSRMSVLGELFSFIWERKLWWLLPMVTILVILGLFLLFAASSPIAPFIYTLF